MGDSKGHLPIHTEQSTKPLVVHMVRITHIRKVVLKCDCVVQWVVLLDVL